MGDLNCPECGETLTTQDKESGPEAPEVGWNYYECPYCGARTRPETIEGGETTEASKSDKVKFTGTVVQTSDSYILDDGSKMVTCYGLDSELNLGEQVTIIGRKKKDSSAGDGSSISLTDCTVKS